MSRLVSSIYSKGPSAYADERRARDVAEASKRAWHERGIAMIAVDDLLDDWERQTVINIAARLYGRRNGIG